MAVVPIRAKSLSARPGFWNLQMAPNEQQAVCQNRHGLPYGAGTKLDGGQERIQHTSWHRISRQVFCR